MNNNENLTKEQSFEDLDILYCPNFFSDEDSKKLYDYLMKSCDFQQKTVSFSGIENKIPRLIQWYGPYPYFYSGLENEAIPLSVELQDVADMISMYAATQGSLATFNSVLINFYRNGDDKIGMHSDDESQLGSDPVIASVSLGDTRTFKMRHNTTKQKTEFLLNNGDLFIMKGKTQSFWKHGISAQSDKGPRINLTFRNIKYPPNLSKDE
jgi:alkylated DNA repair dioxygenase AlkB